VTLNLYETIGALTIGFNSAILDIGGNQLTVTDAGNQAGTVTVTSGAISISGGTLSATNGFSVSANGEILGSGTLIGTIAGAGRYAALNGTLQIESAVLASATGLAVEFGLHDVLELDSTVASGAVITFLFSTGTLDLTDISGNVLQGFSGTIAGLNVGTSATVPTNQIDLAGLATANITATSLDTTTDVLTVTTSGGSFTLQLSGSYAANTVVAFIADGALTGTDLFLVAGRAFSWASAASGNWSTAADWTPSGGPPSTSADTADISGFGSSPAVTLDGNETIGALKIGDFFASLAIGSNQLTVTDAGGQAGTVTLTSGIISMANGGTLSATNGFSAASGTEIFGTGTLIGTIAGAGIYRASGGTLGGTLRIESAVLASATGLEIFNRSTTVLELDSTVASGAAITFDSGGAGTLDLTDISGNLLVGFGGTIGGLNVGTSRTVPTNQIDLAGLAKANITAASLDTTTDLLTVTTTGGSFTLQLSGSYAANTGVGFITDGATTGTDLFLVAGQAFSWASSTSGNWLTAGDWSPSGGPPSSSADSADISAGGPAYIVTLDANETIGALTIGNAFATLHIVSKQLTAGTVTVTAGFIDIGGTLSATNGLSVSAGGVIFGVGTLIGTIAGAGIYDASGGTLRLESAVLATATGLSVDNGGTDVLRLDSTVAAGAVITFFSNTGTLDLTDISGNLLQGFGGTIAGLNVGTSATVPTNQIDLAGLATANITAASLNTSSDVVTVTTTGGSFTLQLSGSYSSGTFVDWITDGAATGSDVFLSSVACYCRGTRILTDRGEVAVEELAIGDRVATISGAARPVKWIGRRSYDGRFVRGNREVLPIIVKAGALADGVPARDLFVSPAHALYIDSVLVPAEHLLNGATIAQAESVERVEYFHIELDTHDVVFAEGAAAESFVDCDNRGMFYNADEFALLYPGDERPAWDFCAPRLGEGSDKLANIRAGLLARAAALGYELTPDPGPYLVVDGAPIRPDSVDILCYRFTVPAGSRRLWVASRSTVPAEIDAAARDLRRLGLPIHRIMLHDDHLRIEIGHGDARLCDGFHADEDGHRWTDGMARLPEVLIGPLSGAFMLELRLASCELAYPIPPPALLDAAATA
jgi:hypothetical protein